MKIKGQRKAKWISLLTIAAVLSLTSCQEKEQRVERVVEENEEENKITSFIEIIRTINQAAKTSIDLSKEIQNIKKNSEIYIEEITASEDINIFYSDNFDSLRIFPKRDIENPKELSIEFYQKLNLFIKTLNIKRICFEEMEDQIDFSNIDFSNISELIFSHFNGTFDSTKVNVSNLTELHFYECQGKFNYSGFPRQIDQLYLSNTSLEMTKEIFSHCKIRYFSWSETIEKKGILKDLLEYLIENDISIKTFDLNQWNMKDYNGITTDEFNLLGKANIDSIYIQADGFKAPLDLDITLNKNINSFNMKAYNTHRDENNNTVNGELGNIKIHSTNKELHLDFSYTNITENTRFSVPDTAWISLGQLNCTDISAFKDLQNVTYLWFKENNGPGPEADTRGEIRYCSDPTVEFYNLFEFDKKVDCYRDYDKLLKDLEHFFKLKQLKAKLNVSPYERNMYYNKASIGDYATLVSDDVDVYQSLEDLSKKQNPVSSYFGDSIDRCISSICLGDGENEINVNDMEEYEHYLSEGYEVIGYSYINIYATSKEDREIFVPVESAKLKRLPFE